MKVTIYEGKAGSYCAYLVKKDLEAAIVERDQGELWGASVLLDNGWRLELPALPADTPLPIVVEARRLGTDVSGVERHAAAARRAGRLVPIRPAGAGDLAHHDGNPRHPVRVIRFGARQPRSADCPSS